MCDRTETYFNSLLLVTSVYTAYFLPLKGQVTEKKVFHTFGEEPSNLHFQSAVEVLFVKWIVGSFSMIKN